MSEDEKREERIKMAEFRIKIYGSMTNSSEPETKCSIAEAGVEVTEVEVEDIEDR